MLAVDTNVIVRLLTNDEPAQAGRAAALFASNEIFVSKTVLLETEWVLRFTYKLDRTGALRALLGLVGMGNVSVEDSRNVAGALELYERGFDLADALHVASSGSAKSFVTFDARLVRRAKGMAPIEVVAL